jgi:formylglycine-generating enzyme required for sulfatase activity
MSYKSTNLIARNIFGILCFSLSILACNLPLLNSETESQSTNTEDTREIANQNTTSQNTTSEDIATESPIPAQTLPPEPGSTLRWIDSSLLVYIPPGEFIMGHDGDDNPEHAVYLDGYWIYRTEVTNRMYLNCVGMGKCSPPAVDPAIPDQEDPEIADLPVVGVRWHQAAEYCKFVDGALPTEAQWEKTARGDDARFFPWGNDEPNCDLLNFNDCVEEISPVINYPLGASPYDVLDMAGNVFEWVADWYLEDYYSDTPFDNPMGPEIGEARSVRGSTFRTETEQVESSLRYFLEPDEYRSDLGFRCVVGKAQEYAPPCSILADNKPELADTPDDPPGGSAACIVQEPTFSVVTYCENGHRGNNISWTPADADVNYSSSAGVSCSQYDVDTLACAGIFDATIDIEACKSCPPPVVELGTLATCDPPYIYDNATNLCKYDGPPVPGNWVCAPGYSLSGDDSCCALEEGTPLDFPICPVGGDYDPVAQVCWFTLPSTGDEKCVSESVFFEWCAKEREIEQEPEQEPEDEPEPSDCTEYNNLNDCEKKGCIWDPAVGCLEP